MGDSLKVETLYVVAFSQDEADRLATTIGWCNRADAEAHLERVKAPPTDPFYAQQYKIWEVEVIRG